VEKRLVEVDPPKDLGRLSLDRPQSEQSHPGYPERNQHGDDHHADGGGEPEGTVIGVAEERCKDDQDGRDLEQPHGTPGACDSSTDLCADHGLLHPIRSTIAAPPPVRCCRKP